MAVIVGWAKTCCFLVAVVKIDLIALISLFSGFSLGAPALSQSSLPVHPPRIVVPIFILLGSHFCPVLQQCLSPKIEGVQWLEEHSEEDVQCPFLVYLNVQRKF